MKHTRKLIIALFTSSLALTAQPRADLPQIESARVFAALGPAVRILGRPYQTDSLLNRMGHYKVPGLGIALIENNEIRWVRFFGAKDQTAPSAVSAATRFMVKSLSKPVTAYATLRLVAQGVLDLDEPLGTYLKRWRVPNNEFTEERSPTLRMLLSHSAGFTLHGVPSYKQGDQLPTLVQALNGEPPAKPRPVTIDYTPGTKTRYSGGGYSVLQLLLEDVSGANFPDLMRSLALDSLRMNMSGYYPGVPRELIADAAVGHGNDGQPIDGKWERLIQMAAGGLLSTPEDMARFVIEVNRAWGGESELLSDSLARLMLVPNESGWGLGFEMSDRGSRMSFAHTGSGDGFRAVMVGFPALRKGAVILANGEAGSELRFEILRSLANEYAWPSYKVVQRPAIVLLSDELAKYTGRYEYSDGSATVVSLDNAQLYTSWRGMPPRAVYPQTRTLFFSLSNEEFIFTPTDSTGPRSLTWRGSFGEFTARRQN